MGGMDVDFRQTMVQKHRNVGDLLIRLDPAGAKYGQVNVSLESVRDPRAVRDVLSRQANVMRHAMLDYTHGRDVEKLRAGASSVNVGRDAPTRESPPGPLAEPSPAAVGTDLMGQLRQLGELRDAGIVTPEEFDAKKTDLLSRL